MSILDSLNQLWNQVLNLLQQVIIPDWGSLIALLPLALLALLLGPVLTLLALAWFVYMVRKPRGKLTVVEGPQHARLDAGGQPVYPTGQPYCALDALIYPSGATTCDTCGQELVVTCPKCGIGRQARVDTCANCGLILKIDKRAEQLALQPAGPPPGGAAAA
ncbi:MAG TPA: hypothetical protein VLR93_07360 [Patescibacteria group bacterium]|nr:hypothetical protein [Patescibacteria group bacterium]HSS36077.1 hypothetical protein [Patescibacteria group bacterium]